MLEKDIFKYYYIPHISKRCTASKLRSMNYIETINLCYDSDIDVSASTISEILKKENIGYEYDKLKSDVTSFIDNLKRNRMLNNKFPHIIMFKNEVKTLFSFLKRNAFVKSEILNLDKKDGMFYTPEILYRVINKNGEYEITEYKHSGVSLKKNNEHLFSCYVDYNCKKGEEAELSFRIDYIVSRLSVKDIFAEIDNIINLGAIKEVDPKDATDKLLDFYSSKIGEDRC